MTSGRLFEGSLKAPGDLWKAPIDLWKAPGDFWKAQDDVCKAPSEFWKASGVLWKATGDLWGLQMTFAWPRLTFERLQVTSGMPQSSLWKSSNNLLKTPSVL